MRALTAAILLLAVFATDAWAAKVAPPKTATGNYVGAPSADAGGSPLTGGSSYGNEDVPFSPLLEPLKEVITSKRTAVALVLFAIVYAGFSLVFGGQIQDFARTLFCLAIVAGLVIGAPKLCNLIFHTSF